MNAQQRRVFLRKVKRDFPSSTRVKHRYWYPTEYGVVEWVDHGGSFGPAEVLVTWGEGQRMWHTVPNLVKIPSGEGGNHV